MARFDLTDKVALIAGASRGIGEAIARTFAEHGARVIVASRKLDACAQVADTINAAGGRARAIKLHLAELADHDAALASIAADEGRLDILVNNGATNPHFGPAVETTPDAWDKTIAVNLRGPYFLSAKAAPMLKRSGAGAIVNVASVNGVRAGLHQGVYSMTKAALISMTHVFAQELGAEGIRVNALAPGLTDTRLASALTTDPAAVADLVRRNMSVPRIAQPEDMAHAALYLASDEAAYVTGHTLIVDGGMTARGPL